MFNGKVVVVHQFPTVSALEGKKAQVCCGMCPAGNGLLDRQGETSRKREVEI